MNTNHCDHERIKLFLDTNSNPSDLGLIAHLEKCETCRDYLDQQVASDDEWIQAGQMLRPDHFDLATKHWYSAGSNAGQRVVQSVAIEKVLGKLAPTDDPHRLGRLGKYEVMGVIGAGGMGVVLKAFESSLDRVVAIKVMAPHLASNERARQRFEREARAAAAVINPNVIPIYSVTSEGELPYLVMAYIQGGSLQQRLDMYGAASIPEVLRIGSQIASGLAAAHEQGLVHRDIKPENILFEGDVERVAITDFGLARAVDDNTVTQVGTIAGTPMYMSPEQARGEQVDQQSDLFSLGSVLYSLCTGQPPYRADSSLGVMRKITDEAPTPILELNPETPEWLSTVIERLMARDKAERFASAAEVREVLEACLSHVQQPSANPLPASLKRESRSTGKGLAAKLLVMGALVFGLLLTGSLLSSNVFRDDHPSQLSPSNERVFKPLAAMDGYIHTMLIAAKDPDSTFLGVSQIGESENSLILKPFDQGIRIKYYVSDPSTPSSPEGKFAKRIREVAQKISVPITERPQTDHNGNFEAHVLSLTVQGERRELVKTISQLVAQVFGVDRTSECRFTFNNLPVQDGDDRSKRVSRKEFLEALDSGYVYAGELLDIIYIGPPELTARHEVPWTDSIYWIRVNDLQEDELGVARLGKAQFAALQRNNENLAVAAGDNATATLADLSDSDLALVYQQITGAELAVGFISGSDLANSVNILLGYDNVSREKIAEKLVKLGKPDVAKIVLSSGRVDASATEAIKMGDLLLTSGDGTKAVDAYLTALRIAPRLFNEKYIETFDKGNRLKDLAELFTEDRIRETQLESVTPMNRLLERLMQDDLRASVGMPFMDRMWKARPGMRAWILSATPWNEVPDRVEYFAQLLIPSDVKEVGNGWNRLFNQSGAYGGWLHELRNIIDEQSARQLVTKVKPLVMEHEDWAAGTALLGTLEAFAGNYEPAKNWIQDNHKKWSVTRHRLDTSN